MIEISLSVLNRTDYPFSYLLTLGVDTALVSNGVDMVMAVTDLSTHAGVVPADTVLSSTCRHTHRRGTGIGA